MTSIAASPPEPAINFRFWGTITLVAAVLVLTTYLPPEIRQYPKWAVIPFSDAFGAIMSWMTRDEPQIPFLPSIKDTTRAVAGVLDTALAFYRSLLATGFRYEPGDGPPDLPPLPWFVITGVFIAIAYRLGGRKLTLVTATGLLFIAVTGNWTSAMSTLSSVIVAALVAIAIGLVLGIVTYRNPRFEKALSPLLDLMQTMPVFAYLVPVLMLLGFGPAAACAATIIFAVPPMIRATALGLHRVPPENTELSKIAGCSSWQHLSKVMIPSALPSIMVGVNQVIMLTLNMVIIASMIGAGGLGYDVLTALRRLDIGTGFEAGFAIVALAVILDRQTQAMAQWTSRAKTHGEETNATLLTELGLLTLAVAAIYGLTILVPSLAYFPKEYVFSAREPLNDIARWITLNLSGPLDLVKSTFLIWIMVPLKQLITALPWFVIPVATSLAALWLDGWKLAILCFLLTLFVFAAGLQDPALLTIYLCGLGVIVSLLIGVPLGVLAAQNRKVHAALNVLCDTLQTLPSFVYLIPVVMLFRVGEFSALIAIVAFAFVPAVRYTAFGIRKIPASLIEAGLMSGCTPSQVLRRIQLPLAVPEILLGVSQTIMMALSMLVITALVGTKDLGQETYIALVKASPGRGITAGLAIAFIAIVSDRLVSAWSRYKFRQLKIS